MMRFLPLLSLLALGCNQPLEEVSTQGTNAISAYENIHGDRVETFSFGGDTSNAVVDYVFVLDNSISMGKILKRVRSGFQSLDTDVWPRDARIAVLGTQPHDFEDPDLLHRTLERMMPSSVDDPGFTQFVSAESIAAYLEAVPARAQHFKLAGCSEWFTPEQVNADGKPCIQAHTQIALGPVGAEAGLTSFKQLLELNAGEMTFRAGASVNVVFVSDTHDPGAEYRDAADLLEKRPTAAELVKLIQRDNTPSSIRFHAIAPETECVEKWKPFGPSYFDAVDATGGQRLDACTAKDYRPILNAVITGGARPTRPVFALGARPEQVSEVTVDGEPTTFTVREGTVEVDVKPGASSRLIEISYVKAIDAKVRKVKKTRRKRSR